MSNDFLPFAVGGAANVESQSDYVADSTTRQSGFQSGVANSAKLNKVWRQSSIMSAVVAQFAADYSGQNSTDDGTTATLEANLVAAIRSATKTGVILADTGAANAYTAVNTPPLVSGTWVDGVVQQVRIAHANTGASTYAPDGLTAIPIYGLGLQPLQGGELALNGVAILMRMTIPGVNSGNPIAVLMECAGGAQQVSPATQSQHAMQLGQATGRLLGAPQVFTSSGTYTRNAAATFVIVEVQGGGAGTGGAPATSSGQFSGSPGASSGAYAKVHLTAAQVGTSQTVTIGAAGTAGGAGSSSGSNGGTSSLGSIISSPGGVGSSSYGPTGATFVATAPSAFASSPTISAGVQLLSNRGNQGTPAFGGIGVSVIAGGGAVSPMQGSAAGTGAGAGGTANGASAGAQPGFAGNAGQIIIWEFA